MYEKFRTQRSSPSRLNGVAPKNRIGTSLVRKKCRTSEMFFSRRRCCPEPEANAASVPTLTSRGLAVGLAPVVFVAVALAVRFTGVDLLVVVFLAVAVLVAFDGLLARTGRSLMACTSLSSDIPDTRPLSSGMDAVDGADFSVWAVPALHSQGYIVQRFTVDPRLSGWSSGCRIAVRRDALFRRCVFVISCVTTVVAPDSFRCAVPPAGWDGGLVESPSEKAPGHSVSVNRCEVPKR